MTKDDDLPAIAEKAINSVLRYHDENHTSIGPVYQGILHDKIAELLPHRLIADDPESANVEIVSDAAIAFLDLYNQEHRDNPVDEKWMFIGVQCLACLDLKPSFVCGVAPRLPVPNAPPEAKAATPSDSPGADGHEKPQHVDIQDHIGDGSRDSSAHESPLALRPLRKRGGSTQDEPASASNDDDEPDPVKATPGRVKKRRSNGPQVANSKEAWGDEEIMKLVKWKAQGMTHKEIGAILGRTEPACAIRHSIVLKQDRWNTFAREYREKRAAGEVSDEEGESKAHEMGSQGKDGEKVGPEVKLEVAAQPEVSGVVEVPQLEDGDARDGSPRDEDPRDEDYME